MPAIRSIISNFVFFTFKSYISFAKGKMIDAIKLQAPNSNNNAILFIQLFETYP